tara:strand:- start:374 stop:601 length:228 start_codon:yes stop_codon:yes gene_type:complete
MKKKSSSTSILLVINLLISLIILFFVYDQTKIKNSDVKLLKDKLLKIDKKLDDNLVPSSRIKKKRDRRKKTDWKK